MTEFESVSSHSSSETVAIKCTEGDHFIESSDYCFKNGKYYCENHYRSMFLGQVSDSSKTEEIQKIPIQGIFSSCSNCHHDIDEADGVLAMDNAYHSNCFCCTKCHKVLSSNNYKEEDGKLYCADDCDDDADEFYCEKEEIPQNNERFCFVCDNPVESGLCVADQCYHVGCFKCTKCRRSLGVMDFIPYQKKVYCDKHFHKMTNKLKKKGEDVPMPVFTNTEMLSALNRKCHRCNLEANDGVYALNNFYHTQCVICDVCRQPVDVRHYKIFNGKIYCVKDYPKKGKNLQNKNHPLPIVKKKVHTNESGADSHITCVVCNKTVMEGIYAQKSHFHVKCFRCNRCRTLLCLTTYKTADEKIYCSRDYNKLMAKVTSPAVEAESLLQSIDEMHCCQCKSIARDGWFIGDQVFHSFCFKCTQCQEILSLNQRKELGGAIYCVEHYKKLNANEPRSSHKKLQKQPSNSGAPVQGEPIQLNERNV